MILIHDGLAENGHYYSYVYDRINKLWWQYDDHRVQIVSDDVVLVESLGEVSKLKSACNLVYISPHIVAQIDQLKEPAYASITYLKIEPILDQEVEQENAKYD